METKTIFVGDSLALSYSTDPEQDMTGWACRVMVKSTLAGAAAIDKNLTDLSASNRARIGKLTPVETAALTVGDYFLVAELSNATTEESKEIHHMLTVKEQGVF